MPNRESSESKAPIGGEEGPGSVTRLTQDREVKAEEGDFKLLLPSVWGLQLRGGENPGSGYLYSGEESMGNRRTSTLAGCPLRASFSSPAVSSNFFPSGLNTYALYSNNTKYKL